MSNDSPRPFSRPTASRPGSACEKATTLQGREWRTVGAGGQLGVWINRLQEHTVDLHGRRRVAMLVGPRCGWRRVQAKQQNTTGVQPYSDEIRESCMR